MIVLPNTTNNQNNQFTSLISILGTFVFLDCFVMKERWRSILWDISFFVISLKCKLSRFLAKGEAGRVNGLHRNRAIQKVYLSGYLALVLFSLSGLILQGGVFVLIGIVCWSCAFFGCINYYNKRICRIVKN